MILALAVRRSPENITEITVPITVFLLPHVHIIGEYLIEDRLLLMYATGIHTFFIISMKKILFAIAICLIVGIGCTRSQRPNPTANIVIGPGQPPARCGHRDSGSVQAYFTMSNLNPTVGEVVTFDGSCSVGQIAKVEWDFDMIGCLQKKRPDLVGASANTIATDAVQTVLDECFEHTVTIDPGIPTNNITSFLQEFTPRAQGTTRARMRVTDIWGKTATKHIVYTVIPHPVENTTAPPVEPRFSLEYIRLTSRENQFEGPVSLPVSVQKTNPISLTWPTTQLPITFGDASRQTYDISNIAPIEFIATPQFPANTFSAYAWDVFIGTDASAPGSQSIFTTDFIPLPPSQPQAKTIISIPAQRFLIPPPTTHLFANERVQAELPRGLHVAEDRQPTLDDLRFADKFPYTFTIRLKLKKSDTNEVVETQQIISFVNPYDISQLKANLVFVPGRTSLIPGINNSYIANTPLVSSPSTRILDPGQEIIVRHESINRTTLSGQGQLVRVPIQRVAYVFEEDHRSSPIKNTSPDGLEPETYLYQKIVLAETATRVNGGRDEEVTFRIPKQQLGIFFLKVLLEDNAQNTALTPRTMAVSDQVKFEVREPILFNEESPIDIKYKGSVSHGLVNKDHVNMNQTISFSVQLEGNYTQFMQIASARWLVRDEKGAVIHDSGYIPWWRPVTTDSQGYIAGPSSGEFLWKFVTEGTYTVEVVLTEKETYRDAKAHVSLRVVSDRSPELITPNFYISKKGVADRYDQNNLEFAPGDTLVIIAENQGDVGEIAWDLNGDGTDDHVCAYQRLFECFQVETTVPAQCPAHGCAIRERIRDIGGKAGRELIRTYRLRIQQLKKDIQGQGRLCPPESERLTGHSYDC